MSQKIANQGVEFKVVENTEDQLKAFLVRGIVYMHEQNCPYDEEFDQNDFAATQILGHAQGDPVACARIRWFDGFAKFERLAIRTQFRGQGHGHKLLQFMMSLALRKGFRVIYLHANAELVAFYESYGFQTVRNGFSFSDYDYVEMVLAIKESNVSSVDLEHDPHVLNRPEGRWDVAGPIEKSLERAAAAARKLA